MLSILFLESRPHTIKLIHFARANGIRSSSAGHLESNENLAPTWHTGWIWSHLPEPEIGDFVAVPPIDECHH